MREKKAYWIGGTVIACAGVALVKLLAPELSDLSRTFVVGAGYILVAAGITTITFGTRREPSQRYITVDDSADR